MEGTSVPAHTTAARHQEAARLLAESDRQRRVYETVLTNTPDFVYVFSLDYKVLYANDALLRMWGHTYRDTIGKTFLEVGYEPWHAEMHEREIDQVRATRQPIRGEVHFNGTHGRREYDYIFVPVIGADGEVEAVAGTTRDVTERKKTEAQLRASEERQTFLVTLTDALRPLVDMIDVQAEACRLLGEHLGANRVVYFEIQGDEYVIERDHVVGVAPLAGRYPVSNFGPAIINALLAGRIIVESDATTEPTRSPEEQAGFAAIQVRGHVDVPLVKDGNFVAGMTVHVSEQREWTHQEVALIRETAERTWSAVERVRVEAALRQSEERLRIALGAARMVAWDFHPDTGVVLTSDNAADVYGFSSGSWVENLDRGLELLHPDDAERVRATLAKASATGEPFVHQFRMVRPDTGAVQWMEERGHAVRDSEGRTTRLVGVNMDITARKLAEETLRASEERLAFVRRSSGVGFWYCDLPFDVLQWDDLVKAHFHLPPDATVTIRDFYDRIHPDDREATRQAIDQSIAGHTRYNVDYRTVHPDTGAVTWVRAIGRTFYADDGTPTRFDGVTLDVSDQKRAEESLRESEAALREADRRKDEFLATLAHELRNPLAPIRNGLEVIRLSGSSGAVEQARSMMERQLTQMVRLVDDLLDMSRVTMGKLELRRGEVEVRTVIDSALETSRPLIEQAGHELTVTMPGERIFVNGDVTRLSQVVSNLLNNSAKYTPRGGHVRLTVGRSDDMVVVSVADDGTGIPEAMLERVFDMFTQVDRSLEKTTGGLGIGLSLVKGLVEMHGGTIEARSEGEGRGSEFILRLPVASSVVHGGGPSLADDQAGASRPRRILVVDDYVDSAESIGELLRFLGNEVRTAYDGMQALEVAESFWPDVILLDIGMPRLNGYEVAQRIRAGGRDTVLVALTGWGQEEDRRKTSAAGFDRHLVKPVEFVVLRKLLAELPAPRRDGRDARPG